MKNKKGFTLIELLAVIVIMGILMMVAIPAVSRVIENSRKDAFVDIAKSYANAVITAWTSENLTCEGIVSSAVDDGDYYILINTKEVASSALPVLLEQGGKSSWGNRDVNGYVRVHVETVTDSNGDSKRTTKFYVGLSDGTHGIIDEGNTTSDKLKKGNVKMNLSDDDKKRVELTKDNGNLNCTKLELGTYVAYSCTEVTPVTSITGLCADNSGTSGVEDIKIINPTNFSGDDWTTISVAAKSGNYTGKYKVGDTKEIDLGSFGKHTVRIANLSTPSECLQKGFSQTACGFVLEFTDIIEARNMNPTNSNRGGYPASELRSYLNDKVYNAFPNELKDIIINTTAVSGYGYYDSANFISTDKLYLLDARELWGTSFNHENNTANNYERQLDYYASNGVTLNNYSRVVKKLNGANTIWWLRTSGYTTGNFFYYVTNNGYWSYFSANNAYGVSPAFRIA